MWLLFWLVVALHVQGPPQGLPMVLVAPGNGTILPCFFSAREHLNVNNLIINWQNGNTVIHSFYHGRDQLERQGQAYQNRTGLFIDQILSGNASLSLTDVQPEDQGEYTCYITSEEESTKGSVMLMVAAPYDEPVMCLQPACDSINVTVIFSNGFPQPDVTWRNSLGEVINESHSSFYLGSRKRYEVSSTISVRLSTIERVTMEMKLEVFGQSVTRSLHLHPLPDACQECCQTTCSIQNRTQVGLLVTLIGLIFTVIFIIKKCK